MNNKELIAKGIKNLKKAIAKRQDDYTRMAYVMTIQTIISEKLPDKPTLYVEGTTIVLPYIGW